jgi:hypothetical protein
MLNVLTTGSTARQKEEARIAGELLKRFGPAIYKPVNGYGTTRGSSCTGQQQTTAGYYHGGESHAAVLSMKLRAVLGAVRERICRALPDAQKGVEHST